MTRISRLRRYAIRLLIGLAALLALSLALGRFLPVPSTLMLGRWLGEAPVTRQWVPLDAVAPAMMRAVIASEDQRFCLHRGVDFGALAEVLEDPDGPSRGASTVTMQVVKNVYLWPGRSYIRKGLEIPLALLVDLAWGKARVMEVYLNIAEWGEGIFGVEAAARHYFGKPALRLSATESARLVAMLPDPRRRDPRRDSASARRVSSRSQAIGDLAACVTRGG
ncbi:MAG: monofunctional biosynthetic peptidoglycan transglycosylase [Beijerinckiaceae bacterium]|jgi:monofunctional biosynthetic peptidoglycan transglycosylase|nr:monofunctional biosynthetic peptidoglycan transglycosylase [Beijerinckiaceae bacterium]